MRGFVPVFAVALVFVSLAGFVAAHDILGLFSAGSSIAVQINKLDTPPGVDLGVSEYADTKDRFYKQYLKAAWESGLQARQQAAAMIKIVQKTTFGFDAVKSIVTFNFNHQAFNYEARAKELFRDAIRHSYETFYALTDLVKDDVLELDTMGADNENYSGIAQVRYTKAAALLSELFPEPCDSCVPVLEINPCGLIDIKSKSICVKRQIELDSSDPEFVAGIYNAVLGYHGNSLLKDYYRFHKELVEAGEEMMDEYRNSTTYFDDQLFEFGRSLSYLENNGVEEVTQHVMNAITAAETGGLGITAQTALSLSEDYGFLKSETETLSRKKTIALRLVSEKNDDYVFKALLIMQEQNVLLREYNSRAIRLRQSLESLYQRAKSTYDRMREENAENSVNEFYIKALEHAEKAKSATTKGKAIAEYSAAIELLSVVEKYGGVELSEHQHSLDRLAKLIKALEDAGADVSFEKSQYEKLLRIKDEALLSQVLDVSAALEEKLEIKFSRVLAQIEELREKASNYLDTAELFLSEPTLAQHLDREKVATLRRDYEISTTMDMLSHVGKLHNTYSGIVEYLKPKIDALASRFLSATMVFRVFSDNPCGTSTIVAEITNPSLVKFVDVVVSKQLNTSLRSVEGASYANGIISFRIDEIYPGETKGVVFTAQSQDCFESDDFRSMFSDDPNSTVHNIQMMSSEMKLLGLNEKISRICFFKNCTELRMLYDNARSLWENSSILNTSLLEQKIDEAALQLLQEFKGQVAMVRIGLLDALIGNFSRAVDTSVDVAFDDSFLIYSEQDYESAVLRFSHIKEIHDVLNPLSLASETEEFFELVSRFSADDLKNYWQDTEHLEKYLNTSLSKLKNDARLNVMRAKADFERTLDETQLSYLEKAKGSYEGGYYNRAIIYSRQVPSGMSISGAAIFLSDVSWVHLAVLVGVAGFVFFLVRKPKEEKKKRVLQRID